MNFKLCGNGLISILASNLATSGGHIPSVLRFLELSQRWKPSSDMTDTENMRAAKKRNKICRLLRFGFGIVCNINSTRSSVHCF